MTRYFFDLQDHENSPDTEGTDLADDNAARRQAVLFAGEYLRDHTELVWDGQEIRVRVRDESGSTVFTVVTLSVDCR